MNNQIIEEGYVGDYIVIMKPQESPSKSLLIHSNQILFSGCIARYTADAGEITSPGYPNVNYANFQTCTWTIDIPSGKGVKVMLDRSEGVEIADNEDFIQVNIFFPNFFNYRYIIKIQVKKNIMY